ncbi:CVNH domain-containing protein [Colletotrichum karsti]|uniref:CVNH domain-containing protein n=1 Tax=Colletotrichum karsti TaxID=1095194 RepID=A0A9P6I0T6_9PEZI|nr:CVNH domain-containing protein [Colletotrichum karsti]KAF9873725.1 CVNH domain-containing protein [Colletotrichum karsti]
MSYYGNNNNGGGYGQQGGGYGQQGGGYGHQGGGHQGGEANSYYNDGRGENQQHQQHQQQFGYGQPPHHQQQNFSSPPPYQNQGHNNNGDHNQGYRNDGPGGYGGPGGPEGEDGERGLTGALAGGAAGAFGGHKVGGNFGHSKTSTFIGAVAGAFAGHKLQDGVSDWKHERDDKKEEEKRREVEEERRREDEERRRRDEKHNHHHESHHERRGSGDRPRGGNYGGGFTGSCRDIRLDAHGDYNLRASCKRRDGSWQDSCISLNRILENDQGSFRWYSGGGGGGSQNYTVQQGDTLRNIAARFNANWEEVARSNNISNPDQIWPGQNLQIHGGGGGGPGGNFGASARDARLVDGGQRLEAELSRNGQYVRSSINLDERIGNNDGTLFFV